MMKKYIVAFSYVFSDLHVQRFDEFGAVQKDIKVPLTYAGKSKLFQKLQRESEIDRKISTMLPRISFIITSLMPDPSRRLNNLNVIPTSADMEESDFLYQGQPWNFQFNLTAWGKYMEDVLMMTEQIAVFFRPDLALTVKEISSLNVERNITITLEDVTLEIQEEIAAEENRQFMADFSFLMKGWLYPPVSTNTEIIKEINVKYLDMDSGSEIMNVQQIWNEINEEIDKTITLYEGEEGETFEPSIASYIFNDGNANSSRWQNEANAWDDGAGYENTDAEFDPGTSFVDGYINLTGNQGDGTDLGAISKVELIIKQEGTGGSGQPDSVEIKPYFGGANYGDIHDLKAAGNGIVTFDITSDTNAPGTWTWDDVRDLEARIDVGQNPDCYWYLYYVEIKVTYTE
jgi:hypothetical protein